MPASRRIGRPRPPGGKPLKLRPELVPRPLWGISAYRLLKRGAAWKRIRAEALSKSGDRCALCGAAGPPPGFGDARLYCHEVWRYDDRNGVATLRGFQILCAGCSSVAHLGRSAALGYLDETLAHLARVNGIPKAAARRIFDVGMEIWRERSGKPWRMAVSAALLTAHPELRVLVGQGAAPAGPATRKRE